MEVAGFGGWFIANEPKDPKPAVGSADQMINPTPYISPGSHVPGGRGCPNCLMGIRMSVECY